MLKFHIELQNPYDFSDIPNRFVLQRWIDCALKNHKQQGEICIRLVDEAEMQQLNHQYRDKNKPTNILSFPMSVPEELELESDLLGDLVICVPALRSESEEQKKDLEAHWAHIIVHGVLHLIGYDHIDDKDAVIMQDLEIKYLNQLGYADPYGDDTE